MSTRFLRPAPKPAAGARTPGYQSPLQRMTSAYRSQQATTAQTTQQNIANLSTQSRRLATAAVTAEKPVQTYLQRAGGLVERRIGSLQAKINGRTETSK
jgi:hypothetical protein